MLSAKLLFVVTDHIPLLRVLERSAGGSRPVKVTGTKTRWNEGYLYPVFLRRLDLKCL